LPDQWLVVPLLGSDQIGDIGRALVTPGHDDLGSEHVDTAFNYIRRRGRFTKAQAQALEKLTDKCRWRGELDERPLGVEIGFGMGLELLAWAEQKPDWFLLGVELYQPGIGSMLSRLQKKNLENVRLVDEPAQLLLERLPRQCIDEVRIFFPDPWPKKRHFKRRLIQPAFLNQLHGALKNHGVVWLATDWAQYAEWMVEHFAAHPGFELVADDIRQNSASALSNSPDDAAREITKFEARGQRLGHEIRDLRYRRVSL
jgi:tRNA (guanine-N7-)-methyltransferase